MSNVTLSHCLIFLDVCLLTCKNKIENDLCIMPDIMSAIELYKLEAQWNIWEYGVCCVGSLVPVLLGSDLSEWTSGGKHLGKDHTGPWRRQGPQIMPISVCSYQGVRWPSKPQILLSHLGVTCLPRRCQRSVTCYTALVTVNCTSQVRQGWQGYYNIWCDVAFCFHHLTRSSFPKLWDRGKC